MPQPVPTADVISATASEPAPGTAVVEPPELPSFRTLYWEVSEFLPSQPPPPDGKPVPGTREHALEVAALLANAERSVTVEPTIGLPPVADQSTSESGDDARGSVADFLLGGAVAAYWPAIQDLDRYRRLNTPEAPYPARNVDLWELYALSRVNDELLRPFQGLAPDEDAETVPWLTAGAYLDFWQALGFTRIGDRPYSPFHHEIVEVEEAVDADEITVAHTFWPGLMFGDLLFSRAGVRVRCRPGVLDPKLATSSTLYWTFRRERRPTMDRSVGWGHNSQWRTDFRCDYEEADRFWFNVHGDRDLGGMEIPYRPRDPDEGLSLAERRELLIHRSFVAARVEGHGDYSPYSYTLSVAKAPPSWPH